jgi:methionyl-tRNA formyltransferase
MSCCPHLWRSRNLTARSCHADGTGIAVACGDGVLKLTELQRAGGKRLAVADFLRGFDIKPGMAFH